MYYVYQLIDPRTNIVFYIGKGKSNRMYVHENYVKNGKIPNGNKKLFDKIKEIKDLGLNIVYSKILETDDEGSAYQYENQVINEIGIENLCNVVDDKLLIGMCDNTKNSNWYYNQYTNEYRLFKFDSEIPSGFIKGSPRTKAAMENWWTNLSDEELEAYKNKMSHSLKNSNNHKLKLKTDEYKKNLSEGLLKSESFKEYNKRRLGSKRGNYKLSDKAMNRRKKSVLKDREDNIVKTFNSLEEVAKYFSIKISTASIWIKKCKTIDNLTLSQI